MGQIDVVNILIKEGADLNIVSPPYNFTALHSVMAILCELEGSETVSNEEDDGYVNIILPEHTLFDLITIRRSRLFFPCLFFDCFYNNKKNYT